MEDYAWLSMNGEEATTSFRLDPGGVDRGRQDQLAAVVKLVITMLWMWGRSRPCGLVWCSKEATIHCWGLAGETGSGLCFPGRT